MAHIDDRWMRRKRDADGEPMFNKGKPVFERDPERYGKGKRWRVRYLDPDGQERSKSFEKKVQAEAFEKEVAADVLRGTYIDPEAGNITFRRQAEEVIANRGGIEPGTRDTMRYRMEKYVYDVIGSQTLGHLARRPSLVQNLVRTLEQSIGPSFIHAIMAHVGLVFSVAVEDGLIAKNPMKSSAVVLPEIPDKQITPWTADQVLGMADALPARWSATVAVGAGLGGRQGEVLGFSPDDVDWLRNRVRVVRQLKVMQGQFVFGAPKGAKERGMPLPESVKIALSEHMRLYPPVSVTLPWRTLDGDPVTVRLFFSDDDGGPVKNLRFNREWRKALTVVGIVPRPAPGEKRVPAREHGTHALRHYFASALLTDGESVRAVAEWMGHRDGGALLLKTYAHLMPSSEQRMRKTIDAALRRPGFQDHGPVTAQEGDG